MSVFSLRTISQNPNWFYCILIVLAAILLHGDALNGNWRWDDPLILRQVIEQGTIKSFAEPDSYIQYQRGHLTPWLILSFQLDWWLFGPEPVGFYVHQLFAIAIASVLVFAVSKQWMGSLLSFGTAILFLSGTPLVYVSEQLMTRHYIEGLIFALISIYMFVHYLDKPKKMFWAASVFCYAAGVTCKEVYVPLVLLLPFIPRGSSKERLQLLVPYVVCAVIYSFYRLYMLGDLIGGNENAFSESIPEFALATARSFLSIPSLLYPNLFEISMLLVLVVLVSGVTIGKVSILRLLYTTILILAPMVPLVIVPGLVAPDRYFLVPWTALSFLITYCVSRAVAYDKIESFSINPPTKILACSVFIALLCVSLYNGRQYLSHRIAPAAAQWDAHVEFLLNNDSSVSFIPGPHVLDSYWFVTRINDIISHLSVHMELPAAILDPIMLEDADQLVYTYNSDCGCMDLGEREFLVRYLAQMTNVVDEQLQIELTWNQDFQESKPSTFQWQLGPWREGEYRLISRSLGNMYMPPEGSGRLVLREMETSFETPFILKYSSPDGWVTYSPELTLDVPPNGYASKLVWSRSSPN